MRKNIEHILSVYEEILNNKKILRVEADISGIDELVYNPATKQGGSIGHGYDNGQKVNGITWNNHDNHLHIGFTNREVAMAVIDYAASLGLKTTENPYAKSDPNGKVDNVHTKGSFHYKNFPGEPKVGAGVDISGDPKKVTELIKWVESKYAGASYSADATTTNAEGTPQASGTPQSDLGQSISSTVSSVVSQPQADSGGDEAAEKAFTQFGKSIGLKESIKRKILNESPQNTDHIFDDKSFKWGGGPKDHGSRPLGNWQSDNAWDVMAPAGTPVYAIEGGKVVGLGGGPTLRKGVIYGYQITIQSEDNSFFYTHLGERAPNINIGAEVKKGDIIGWIGKPNDKWPQHVHIGLKYGNISKYLDKGGNILAHQGGSEGSISSDEITKTSPIINKVSDLISTTKKTDSEDFDPVFTKIGKQIGNMLGLKESFGKNIREKFGTILIPAQSNSKIYSPVYGTVIQGGYARNCKNQILIQIEDDLGYLQFCGISTEKVRIGDLVSEKSLIGTTSEDVEVVYFDNYMNRTNLKDDTFDSMSSKSKSKYKDSDNIKYKQDAEASYYDPAVSAIPALIANVFKNKVDKETGKVEKRWGYATDKEPVDPWIINAVSKPFKKIGKFLGTNKSKSESYDRKVNENIERIKKLMKD